MMDKKKKLPYGGVISNLFCGHGKVPGVGNKRQQQRTADAPNPDWIVWSIWSIWSIWRGGVGVCALVVLLVVAAKQGEIKPPVPQGTGGSQPEQHRVRSTDYAGQ